MIDGMIFGISFNKVLNGSRSRDLEEITTEQIERLVQHFRGLDLNPRKLTPNIVSVGGDFPFNLYLETVSDHDEEKSPSLFKWLFGSKKLDVLSDRSLTIYGNIRYQCDNPDPRPVLDVLRNENYCSGVLREEKPNHKVVYHSSMPTYGS